MAHRTLRVLCLGICLLTLSVGALASTRGDGGRDLDPDPSHGTRAGTGGDDTEGAAAGTYTDFADTPGMGDGTGCRMLVGASRSTSRSVVLGVVVLGLLVWGRQRRA